MVFDLQWLAFDLGLNTMDPAGLHKLQTVVSEQELFMEAHLKQLQKITS